jgi:hypothetical protein
MQQKIDEVTCHMKLLGEQVATQTIQALVQAESPLVTKIDHAQLQHEMTSISTQLTTLIKMIQNSSSHTTLSVAQANSSNLTTVSENTPSSPIRNVKRSKPTTTPEKSRQTRNQTQEHTDYSATSDSEESMEGCAY